MQKQASTALRRWFRVPSPNATFSINVLDIEAIFQRAHAYLTPFPMVGYVRAPSTSHILPKTVRGIEFLPSRPPPSHLASHVPKTRSINVRGLTSRQYSPVIQRTGSKLRQTFGHRTFWTSRPVRSQYEMTDSDLAHLAAQRQVSAASSTSLLRPMLFTIGVSALAWTSAEYWRVNKYFIYKEWRQYKRDAYAQLGLPDPYPSPSRGTIQGVGSNSMLFGRGGLLNNFTPAQQLMLPIVAFCIGVYGMWQFPFFGLRWMYKNFSHIPESGISRTLLTSAFSHATVMHLAFNMLAMWSFSEAAYPLLGPEYYLATVASGAVVASMAQHVYGTVTTSSPALGASGFVFSIVTYVALSYPNNQALLLFVIPAPLLGLLKGLVLFDLVGLTGVWTHFFNFRLAHAAHLGGVGVGALVWWLNQRENRRKLATALPEEAVGLYNKGYDALIKRHR